VIECECECECEVVSHSLVAVETITAEFMFYLRYAFLYLIWHGSDCYRIVYPL
jgi:hypothetical protein